MFQMFLESIPGVKTIKEKLFKKAFFQMLVFRRDQDLNYENDEFVGMT